MFRLRTLIVYSRFAHTTNTHTTFRPPVLQYISSTRGAKFSRYSEYTRSMSCVGSICGLRFVLYDILGLRYVFYDISCNFGHIFSVQCNCTCSCGCRNMYLVYSSSTYTQLKELQQHPHQEHPAYYMTAVYSCFCCVWLHESDCPTDTQRLVSMTAAQVTLFSAVAFSLLFCYLLCTGCALGLYTKVRS